MHKLFWHKYYHFAILLVEATDSPCSRTKYYISLIFVGWFICAL